MFYFIRESLDFSLYFINSGKVSSCHNTHFSQYHLVIKIKNLADHTGLHFLMRCHGSEIKKKRFLSL